MTLEEHNMLNGIRSVVVAVVVCFTLAANAQDSVQVGKNGSVKINSGGTKVNVQPQGSEDDRPEAEPAADADTSSSAIELSGAGRTETLSCSGSSEVSINGSSNDITITGECKSVSVTGSANKVKLEGVGEITVTGSDNTLSWKHAAGKAKKPKVVTTGVGNKVSKAK
jgi:hypothetical protein